jgi:hypothetical protein
MQSDSEVPMQASEAERVLRDVERVRRDTRRDLHSSSFPNLVIGGFFLIATACSALASGPALPIACWAIGLPAAVALITLHEARRERELGAESRLDASFGIFGATIAGVVAVNLLTDGIVDQAAWGYPVAAGWLAIAYVYREALMAAAGVALAAVATVVIAVQPDSPGLWVQLALALLLIAVGLVGRVRDDA